MKQKVILAYSGGLDTSTIVPWLKENYDCEVHCVCVDVGQVDDPQTVMDRAKYLGADSVCVENVRKEFVEEYVWPMLKAGAVYEGKYLLGTSIARPLISKILVDKAKEIGADAICHGATGKGNDQVRFELTIMALAPETKIIAPWRIWNIKSRQDAFDYCEAKGVKLDMSVEQSYSKDNNLWHISHEGLDLEDPTNMPKYDQILEMSKSIMSSADEAEEISIEFCKGIPTKLNGVEMDGVSMIEKLNEYGGKHAIGIADMVENRVVGMKSRGVYETPGGTILYFAHSELEQLALDKETANYKRMLSLKYAEMVYGGMWFCPLINSLNAFVDETQKTVNGEVKLLLYKGNMITSSISSPDSLYDEDIASFSTGELYDHHDAEGFIKLYGLPLKIMALKNQNK